MRSILASCLVALLLTSCGGGTELMTRYHEDGRRKPVVTVTTMIDTSSFDAPWSLSEEITTMVAEKMGQNANVFVEKEEDITFLGNPFGNQLSWIKKEFFDKEFVVFLELIEHEIVPAKEGKKSDSFEDVSTNLNMSVRLRVVDIRGDTPQIALQEMIRESYFIPKTLFPTNYQVVSWGTEEYLNSPMGIAHRALVQEIATRASDYILLAKSR